MDAWKKIQIFLVDTNFILSIPPPWISIALRLPMEMWFFLLFLISKILGYPANLNAPDYGLF